MNVGDHLTTELPSRFLMYSLSLTRGTSRNFQFAVLSSVNYFEGFTKYEHFAVMVLFMIYLIVS